MLNKFNLYLKNIIFIKFVIYTIALTLILYTASTLYNQLERDIFLNKKAYNLHSIAKQQLEFLVNFKKKVLYSPKNYVNLITENVNYNILNKEELINKITRLEKKYNLQEPIFIRLYRHFYNNLPRQYSSNIKLNFYILKLRFKSHDYISMINFCQDLYNLLPTHFVLVDFQVEQQRALTPDVINKLDSKYTPNLLIVKMNIQIREIIYER